VLSLAPREFPAPPRPVARIELPAPYLPNNGGFQRQVADALTKVRLREDGRVGLAPRRGRGEEAMAHAEDVAAHPVSTCPDVARHLKAASRADFLDRQIARNEREVRGRTESLARQFDRVLRVLEAWGYIDGWSLTEAGERLSLLYHECDLLIAEALHTGVFDGLDPAALAGLCSVFSYEHRSPAPPRPPWFPSATARARYAEIEQLSRELNADELEAGLPLTRHPDPGFVALAHAWAAGEDLDDVLEDADVSGGDFVRNVKQLIDLLRQLAEASPERSTTEAAHVAADLLFRGVIAASSVVGGSPGDDQEG
jgi:ATP-dependent RNA helicase HelY